MGWSNERIELLKKLWLEGLSATQIAAELGGVTRNAVLGKVHRLGLPAREHAAPPVHLGPRAPKPLAPEPSPPKPKDSPPVTKAPPPVVEERPRFKEGAERLTVLNLGAGMCKWPFGHPGNANFTFCGKRAELNGPYCPAHARIAYQPSQTKYRGTRGLERSLWRELR